MGTSRLWTLSVFACVGWIVGAAQAQQPALRFLPLTPCRIVDTRNANGSLGGPAIAAQTSRSFPILSSPCLNGVSSNVAAYSLNVTAVPDAGFLGYLTLWPSGQPQPFVSTLNSVDGRVKANAAIVPAGTDVNKSVSVYVTDLADVILDINGYFVPASNTNPTPLAFFPLPPCRVVDTRNPSGLLGGPSLVAQQARSFPVLSSSCNIPSTAQAYSLNFTAVPHGGFLGFLTTWPTGLAQPWVSTLNATTGVVTANAAIVPAGKDGAISVYVTDTADLVIDANGYFAPSTSGTDLSLYTLPPCRVLDTRLTLPGFVGTLPDDTTASPCGVIPSAQAVVLNATVVPVLHFLGYLTLWPDGQSQPFVSTLNAVDGLVTSNMGIVPTGSSTSSGVIDAYVTDYTQLILDTSGYFASGTAPAPSMYTLTVARSGVGSGTVTSLDGKFNCGAVCAISYLSGTSVTLTTSPTAESYFAGWSGGGCSGTGTCTVGVTAPTSVTAAFGPVKAQGLYLGSSIYSPFVEAVILPNDKLYAWYGATYSGVFSVDGLLYGQGSSHNGSYTANVTDFFWTGEIFTGSVAASYGPEATLSGTLTEPGVGTDTFSGTGLPNWAYNFNTRANLSEIVGLWTGTVPDGSTATARIYSNGTFTGSNLGCSFSGTAAPDASNKNFFSVSLTFGGSPCLQPGLTGSGIAVDYLLPDGVHRQLFVAVTLGSYGAVFSSTNHTP